MQFAMEPNMAIICTATSGQHCEIVLSYVCAICLRSRHIYVVSYEYHTIIRPLLLTYIMIEKNI